MLNQISRLTALTGTISLMLTSAAWAGSVAGGVSNSPQPASATTNSINFDPPCLFAQTLPLQGVSYLDPATQSVFLDGEGAVLDQCSNFGVTGFSAPNFLAWNCNARNIDGTRPVLPLEIKFSKGVSTVSVKVGSGLSVGSPSRLTVYNASRSPIGSVSVNLTSAMQTLTLTRSGIRYMTLSGPCIMVADDLLVQ
jgi:hypothetical protein